MNVGPFETWLASLRDCDCAFVTLPVSDIAPVCQMAARRFADGRLKMPLHSTNQAHELSLGIYEDKIQKL